MAYSTSDILSWADAAQPLAAIGEMKKKYLTGGTVDPDLHLKIYVEKKSLQWQYDQDPDDSDDILYQQGNYVYALLFPYLFEAQQAVGGGGQVVNPTTPSTSVPQRRDFLVSATSYLPTGTTTAVLNEYIGFNLIFIRGGVSQSQIASESTYFTWDAATGDFFCSPALVGEEQIIIIPA